MRRDKEIIRLVMVIVIICYGVCQHGVKGNTLKNDKSEDGNYKEETKSVEDNASEKILEENENEGESTDDTENLNDDPDLDSDAATNLYKRVQEMPLKLGLQFLTAKYGISESLDKARRGGAHIYAGAKDAVKTMADFIGEGISNARFLLFGSK